MVSGHGVRGNVLPAGTDTHQLALGMSPGRRFLGRGFGFTLTPQKHFIES
jgi:hypothetical protein